MQNGGLAGIVRIVLAAILLMLSSGAALAGPPAADAPAIARGNLPDWLVPREVPQATAALIGQSSNGVSWLLLDTQVRAVSGGYQAYSRTVLRVNDRNGLETAGAIRINFDPHEQKATLNYVHVIRDGKVIDHTDDLKLDLLQREGRLDDGLTDGQITAAGNVSDVRVGDIVDYAVTYDTQDRLWPGHYFDNLTMRWSVPVALQAQRITWPSERPLNFRSINTDAAFTRTEKGRDTVYEWIDRNSAGQADEDDVPSWKPAYGLISVSTMSNWREVVDWAVPLYRGDESLPEGFARQVDQIAAKWSKPADRLTEATRLVQDTIRYVGVEIAEGSFVPRRPAEVVRLGYGDCKDKSLLLTVVLRRLGIDAVPALVSTGWGKGLAGWAPSPAVFDHVIVRAQLDGKPVWIDPTLAHQGGRGAAMVTPDYGYVLPLRAGQADLERIVPPAPGRDQEHVVERYDIDAAADPEMRLTVETLYRDGTADWMRNNVASKPMSEISKSNLDYYLGSYPGLVEAKPLAITDDRDANVVRMVETYSLSKADFAKDKLLESFPVKAYALRGVLPARQNGPRRNPLAVTANLRRTQVIEVAFKGRTLGNLEDLHESAEGIRFDRLTDNGEDGMQRLTFTLTTPDGDVPAAKAAAVYDLSDKLGDETVLTYNLGKAGKSLATMLGVEPKVIAPYEERIRRAGELMQKDDAASRIQALTLLNGLAGEIAHPSVLAGFVDGLRGTALAAAGRYPAAEDALEASIGSYQGSYEMMALLAWLQLQAKKPVAAVHTLGVAAAHFPGKIDTLDKDYVRSVYGMLRQAPSDDSDKALADLQILLAKAGWEQSPMTAMGEAMHTEAIRHLVDRGALDDARKLLKAAPVASETAAELAMDERYKALWPDFESAVRDHFRSLIDGDLARSRAALAKSPDDLELLATEMGDLRRAGKTDEAIAAGKPVVADHGRIEAAGEPGFWLVNEYATDLYNTGHIDDALAEMDWLVGLGVDRNPMLISQAINRAQMLLQAGRPPEALAAYQALAALPENHASTYGRMWISAGTVCAAHELGKSDVVGEAMQKVKDSATFNPAAVMFVYACEADMAQLEKLLIQRLDDPKERQKVLPMFSTSHDSPRTDFERRIDGVMKKAKADPVVQKTFRQYGRALQFDGEASGWAAY